MSFKEKLYEKTNIDKERLPASYQIVGDILLVKLLKLKENEKSDVAKAIQELLPYVKTICEISGIDGETRKPKVRKLLGTTTETLHKENGILYALDVEKIMFSKGNHFERKRLLSQLKPTETVVDMFAGIGYFTLSVAKNVKKVIAIEKNPVAFRYLEKNVKLNELKNIDVINADNREVKINEKVDRVLMGYFPDTEKFLTTATNFLKDKGIIHYHNIGNDNWKEEIKELFSDKKFTIFNMKKVKNTGPRKVHFVVDVEVKK